MSASAILKNLLLICFLANPVVLAAAEQDADVEEQLDQLDQQIESLNATRLDNRDKVAAYERQIQDFDQQIAEVSKRSHELRLRVTKAQDALDQLSNQDQEILGRISEQQKTLGTHIQLGWQNSLNHGNLGQPGSSNKRMLRQIWLEYLSAHQTKTLKALANENHQLETLRTQQQQALIDFNNAREAESLEQLALAEKKTERQSSIQTLNKEFQATGLKISDLKQDREELTAILKRLKAARDDTAFIEKGTEFETLKGKLPWPHNGKIAGGKNDPGVTIEVGNGDPVHAIAPGRVAYSEWLKGFGLLLILDHGEGYMSLYGNNESLYRKTGDWVDQGDILAAAGQSGGQREPGLYFEIRASGKSVNSRQWCNSQVSLNQ